MRFASTIIAAAIAGSAFTALAGSPARLYVTNSLGDDITVIDLSTLKPVADFHVGDGVHGICAPADGRTFFTTVESERNLKVVDSASGKILSTIPLTGRPNQCAATPDGRYVGVPIRDGNSVDIVDIPQHKVVKVLPVKEPHNCFNSGNNNELYVSSMGGNEVLRIDLRKMAYCQRIPVGGIPRPYAVSAGDKTLYVALTDFHGFAIADISKNRIVRRIELPPAPALNCPLELHTPTHGLALSPDGAQLWVTSLADHLVYAYDTKSLKMLGKVSTGLCPNWVAFSPDGKYCCVTNSDSNDCSIIDTATCKEVARIKVGKGPKRLMAL